MTLSADGIAMCQTRVVEVQGEGSSITGRGLALNENNYLRWRTFGPGPVRSATISHNILFWRQFFRNERHNPTTHPTTTKALEAHS